MFTKSRVSLSALAFVTAFAPLAAHAGDTPDPQAAIRAQILGVWKGQPVTGAAVVDGAALEMQERAQRALLSVASATRPVPLVAQASDASDVRELARRQILGQPTALRTHASVRDTQTVRDAEAASLYDTYYDEPTGFVFVKLPTGWRFVGRDVGGGSHEVFLDAPTGFVFVKISDGWHFITPKA